MDDEAVPAQGVVDDDAHHGARAVPVSDVPGDDALSTAGVHVGVDGAEHDASMDPMVVPVDSPNVFVAPQPADDLADVPARRDQPRPPRARQHAPSATLQSPLRTTTLKIDVNVAPDHVPPVALASPLALFSTRKPPMNAHQSHPVTELVATDARSTALGARSPFLEYGMIISLVCDDHNSVVAAEGFACRDVRLERLVYESDATTPVPSCKLGLGGIDERRAFDEGSIRLMQCSFRDCLFEVVPKMNYEATQALDDLQRDIAEHSHSPKAASIALRLEHSLADLQFKSDAETRLNAMTYRKMKGTQVMYGHIVQLRHVKTGLFVTVDTSPISFRGAEYAQICLDEGSQQSHFIVSPRFKLRSKGAPVQLTDQMILTSSNENQSYSLYTSSRAAQKGVAVVGSTIHSSQWRALFFDTMRDSNHKGTDESSIMAQHALRAGSCIRLLHLESNSWLQIDQLSGTHNAHAVLQFCDRGEEPDGGLTEGLQSDSMWEVERTTTFEGGDVRWRDSLALRHVLTGQYLSIASAQNSAGNPRNSTITRSGTTESSLLSASQRPQSFRFQPTSVADDEAPIVQDSVILIQHQLSKAFLHSPETHASTMADIKLSSKSLTSGSTEGSVFSVVALPGARDEDAFKIVMVSKSELTDTLLLMSYKPVLQSYITQFSSYVWSDLTSTGYTNHFNKEQVLESLGDVETAIIKLIEFCAHGTRQSQVQMKRRQDMFRSHAYIELLVGMLKAPFKKFGGPFAIDDVSAHSSSISSSSGGDEITTSQSTGVALQPVPRFTSAGSQNAGKRGKKARKGSKSKSMPSLSQNEIFRQSMQCVNRIMQAVNCLLVHTFCGNRSSELLMVKTAMPVLMDLLGNGFLTSYPLSYLLRENRNLVESITAYASIIRNFFDLIKVRGRSIRYMQFLVSLCTSRGRGVPKTQEAICELLFNASHGYRNSVIVPIRPCSGGFEVLVHSTEVQRHSNSTADGDTKSWQTLASFYQDYYLYDKNRALGQYCFGLLQLYVALCLDRNYVSIEYIQQTFPRHNLLLSVQDANVSRSVRSVLLDLIRVAYVDCEPQKTVTCPTLTRIWPEVVDEPEEIPSSMMQPKHSAEDRKFFSDMKILCSSYLERLGGKIVIEDTPHNRLTLSILRVSRKMVEFGMYPTRDELSHLVVGLVNLLDERTDVLRDDDLHRQDAVHLRNQHGSGRADYPDAKMRHRESVTDGGANLFSTMMVKVPGSSSENDCPELPLYPFLVPQNDQDPIPHLLNSALLDESPIPECDRERLIERQYGRDSVVLSRCTFLTCSEPTKLNSQCSYLSLREHTATSHVREFGNQHFVEVSLVIMEIKDEICATLQLVDNIRLDYQISVFLSAFRRRYGCPYEGSRCPADWFPNDADVGSVREAKAQLDVSKLLATPKASPLAEFLFNKRTLECKFSLSQLANQEVTTVLMQMLMYEHPPLVSRALELLLQQHNQHDQLLRVIESVQLLVSEETIVIYNQLRGDVDEFRRLSETTEVWMDLTSKSDYEKAESACTLLRSIRETISKFGVTSASRRGKSHVRFQTADPITNKDASPPVHQICHNAQQKRPPNRKYRDLQAVYQLKASLGNVSSESACHEILPFVNDRADRSPLRKARGYSNVNAVAIQTKRLVRNLKAAQYVINLMMDGAHFYEAHCCQQPDGITNAETVTDSVDTRAKRNSQREQIIVVFEEAMQFLAAFCTRDADNQQLMAVHVTLFAEYIGKFEIAQELLTSIYDCNLQLYKTVPTELVNRFVSRLTEDPTNPRYLLFLESLVICGDTPVYENQLLVLFQLVKSLEVGAVLQMFDDPKLSTMRFAEAFERQVSMTSDGKVSSPNHQGRSNGTENMLGEETDRSGIRGESRLLEYHCRLLHLFAACATGKNTRCQDICQQIIPLSVVLEVLELSACTDGITFAFLRFIRQVFLVADDSEAPHLDLLLRLFEQLGTICVRCVKQYLKGVLDEDVNRAARLSLHKGKQNAADDVQLSVPKNPLESKSLYILLHGIVPCVLSFVQHFPSVAQYFPVATETTLWCFYDSFSAILNICLTRDWDLPDEIGAKLDDFLYYLDVETKARPSATKRRQLVSLWSQSLTRANRPCISDIPIQASINTIAHAIETATSGITCMDTSPTKQSQKNQFHDCPRKEPFRSSNESGAVSDDGISTQDHTPQKQQAVLPNNLRPVEPLRFSNPHPTSQEKTIAGTAPPAQPHVAWGSRLSVTKPNHHRKNPYSRQSTFSIQCNNALNNGSATVSFHNQGDGSRKLTLGANFVKNQRFEEFDKFLLSLCEDPRIDAAMRDELNRMVASILSIDSSLQAQFDPSSHLSNVMLTFDHVVSTLVAHVLSFQHDNYQKTNLILLDVFCRMVYAAEDMEQRRKMQIKLNQLGLTQLVVKLIASRDDEAVIGRTIELGVALLDGMNAEVQETFYRCWVDVGLGSEFLEQIQKRIMRACTEIHKGQIDRSAIADPLSHPDGLRTSRLHSSNATVKPTLASVRKRRSIFIVEEPSIAAVSIDTGDEQDLGLSQGPMTLLFRFLQLLCEGHFLNAQTYIISQPGAKTSVNLVETTTTFLLDTYLTLADLDVGLIIQLFETITEFCQGPCPEAQETVTNFKFLSTVNALMMQSFDQATRGSIFLVRRLRASVVKTLLSVLEGRSDQTIHAQLVQELNFEALQRNLLEVYVHFQAEYDGKYTGNVRCSDDFYLDMGFNIYFLLQQLADRFPNTSVWVPRRSPNSSPMARDNSNVPPPPSKPSGLAEWVKLYYKVGFSFFQANSARVEVVWNHMRGGDRSKQEILGDNHADTPVVPSSVAGEQDNLISYYFPLHPICYCLTDQSKKKLLWHVSRGSNKLLDFYSRSDKLVDEMAHQSRIRRHRFVASISKRSDLFKWSSFGLAVFINLVVLFFYQADGIDSLPYPSSSITLVFPDNGLRSTPSHGIDVGLSIAGTIQLALCSIILVCYLINSAPLLIKKGWKRRIQAQQEKMSKKTASKHKTKAMDRKETLQDTEQLLRSLREREEEYDYLFLPPRHHQRRTTTADVLPQERARTHSARRSYWQQMWDSLGQLLVQATTANRGSEYIHKQTASIHAETGRRTRAQYIHTVLISLSFLVKSPRVVYYVWQIIIAILGAYVNKLFFAFHLLDVINRYQELSNVLRSIVRPAKVLGVTVLLYLIIVYVFATVGFYFFREDYNPGVTLSPNQRAGTAPYKCQRLFQCFLLSLDQGFKSDGGLGGYMKQRSLGESGDSYARLAFDLLYNIILIIMLLNLVFGVIIDTFASLRTADKEKEMDMQNRCFICSIDAYTFDRATKRGFHDHIYMEHNMWHYLYLFVHIRKKPITEYNGLELYLAIRMAKKDVSFFPAHRALCLEQSTQGIDSGSRRYYDANEPGDNKNVGISDSRPSSSGWKNVQRPQMAAPMRLTVSGAPSGAMRSPVSRDRVTAAKLEKLEAAIEGLVSAQAEMKAQYEQTLARQTELIELLSSGRRPTHTPSASTSTTPVHGVSVVMNQPHQQRSRGIVQRSPSTTTTASHSTSGSVAPVRGSHRRSSPPRVFNFDSVVD